MTASLMQRLYMDTMSYDPAAMRFAIELLGAEHVLNGSDWHDWPIASRRQIEETLAALELTADQKAAIMGGNSLRLLARKA